MSNKDRASSFLKDLLDGEDELQQEIADANKEPESPTEQWVVYFVGDKPDTVWSYNHKPTDGRPYGRLEGYFDENKEEKISRHYVRNKSKNLKLMDWDTFLDVVPPNKNCVKIYNSEEEFLLELI